MSRSGRRLRQGHDLRFLREGRTYRDVRIPEPYRAIIDAVALRDREWFAAHRGFRHYVRPSVPGEFWQPDGPPLQAEWVMVTNVADGMRTRRPLCERGPVGDAVRAGVVLFGPDGEEAGFCGS